MPFDISSAKPVEEEAARKGGFDLSSAQPLTNYAAAIPGGNPEWLAGNTPAQNKPAPNAVDYIKGAGETVMNVGTGLLSSFLDPIQAASNRALGIGIPDYQKEQERLMSQHTYNPKTDVGQAATAGANKIMSELLPAGMVAHTIPMGDTSAPRLAKIPKEAKVPLDVAANLAKLDEKPGFDVASAKPMPQPDVMRVTPEGQAYDATIEPFRQAAMEKADLERRAQMTNESQQTPLFAPDEQGLMANKYGANMGDWRVDENGIPVRADLSMDAQHVQEPLQRHLWGDENPPRVDPVGQAATLHEGISQYEQQPMQGGTPLTQAIDSMGWAQRRGAINSQLRGSVEPSGALEGAMAEANRMNGGMGGGQRGAINIDMFDPAFKLVKEIGDNLKLVLRGTSKGPVIHAVDPAGKVVGELRLAHDAWAREPRPGDNLEADWVTTDPKKTTALGMDADSLAPTTKSKYKGLAAEMYRFAAEQGNDVVRSGAQTPEGQAMWKGFQERGLSDGTKFNSGMGGGQKGGLDIQSIMAIPREVSRKAGEAVDAIHDSIDKLSGAAARRSLDRQRALNDVYDTNSIITKPEPAASAMAKMLTEPDGPGKWYNKIRPDLQSGAQMAAEKTNSTMLKNSAQQFTYATNKANYLIKNIVRPVENTLAKLSSGEFQALHQTIQKEMFQRGRYTESQLQQAGFTPKMMEAYKGLRDAFDHSLEVQNQARRAAGQPDIKPQEAYMASMFQGDWHVQVKDKTGNTVWYVQNPTRAQAKKAVAFLQEHFKGSAEVDPSKIGFEFKSGGSFGQIPRDMMSSWKDLVEVLGDSPEAKGLKEAMEQWVKERGDTYLRQDLHQVDKKANVRGFSGDQPWKSATENAQDWGKAQVHYMENSLKWTPLQEALSNVKQYVSNPELQTKQPNNVALTRAFMVNRMGMTPRITRAIESFIAEKIGRSSGAVQAGVGTLKGATYIATLTGSPFYAVATPLQAFPASLAWFAKEAKSGNVSMNGGSFLRAIGDAMQSTSKLGDKLTPFNREALAWAHDNQVISAHLFDDNRSLGAHPILDKLKRASDWTIERPDQWTRSHVFLPFANAFMEGGKYTKEQAFMRAGEITNNIMVSMRREDRPLLIQKMGALGDAAYVFKAPTVNMYNHLSIFGRDLAKGNPVPLLTYLGSLGVIGGVHSLPGVSEFEKSWDLIKDAISKWMPQHYDKVSSIDLKGALLSSKPDADLTGQIMNYGLASAATGTNMSTRFNSELIDLQNPLQGLSPLAQEGKEWLGATKVAVHPTRDTLSEAAYNFAPGPVARGLLENYGPSFKAGTQPSPESGITNFRNPRNVEDPSTATQRTERDRQVRMLGGTSLEEAQRKDKSYLNNMESQRIKQATDNNFNGMWNALFRDDPKDVTKYASAYFRLGGSSDELNGKIAMEAQRLGMTRDQFAMSHADSLQKILNVQRRVEMDKK